MKRTILSAALALALGVTLGIWWQAGTEVHSESEDEADAAVYRCPMHPAVVADHPEAIRIGFAPVAYYPLDFHCLSLVAEACRALVGAVAGVGFDPSRHRSDRTVEGLPLES